MPAITLYASSTAILDQLPEDEIRDYVEENCPIEREIANTPSFETEGDTDFLQYIFDYLKKHNKEKTISYSPDDLKDILNRIVDDNYYLIDRY